jgi:hypothetical protein
MSLRPFLALASFPFILDFFSRRGYKRAEVMDHDEFREAVEWATEHPGGWPESPLLTGIQHDRNIEEENAYDSGVEL